MMFTAFNTTDCDSSRCSTASPAGETLGYYPSPAGSYSDLGSPQSQDFTDLTSSSGSFVPTVSTISTSADLQWMVQPFSSVAPSNRVHPYTSSSPQPPAYSSTAMKSTASRAYNKKGRSDQVSTEEEEKRKVRRERNKQAAAKCRNRRRELTDTLQAETDELEDEKANIQSDIANLLKEKERLEFILAAHRPICKIPSDLDVTFPTMSMSVSPAHSHSSSSSTEEVHMQTQTSPVSMESCTAASSTAPHRHHPSVFTSTSNSIFSSIPVTTTRALRLSDLDTAALEESLELLSKVEMEEAARSVPDVDLSSSLYASQDWEPLYTSPATTTATTCTTSDFESLCTPVVTCTPSGTTYTSSFAFTYPEADAFLPTCGLMAHRTGSGGNDQSSSSDSLSSPTLLAL